MTALPSAQWRRAWPNTGEALTSAEWVRETWGLWSRADVRPYLGRVWLLPLPPSRLLNLERRARRA